MIFFLATLAVIRYYSLEVSRNIRGIILGYGTWLGASVITLALRAYFGPVLNAGMVFPSAYLLPRFARRMAAFHVDICSSSQHTFK